MNIEVTIDRPAAGGEFIASYDGRIGFVTGGIPGERVVVEIAKPDAKLWRGNVVEVLDASEHRVPQRCEAARQGAGCCDWGFIDPEHAARLKADVLTDCLRRLGRFTADELPAIDVVPLAPTSHWRTRVRLGVDSQGRAGLRRSRSHDLVIGSECAQTVPNLIAGFTTAGTIPVAEPARGRGRRTPKLGELHVAMDAEGNRSAVYVSGSGRNRKQTVIEGEPTTQHTAHGITFDVPTTGFWQAHRHAPEFYGSRIISLLAGQSFSCAWDLYGGAGVLAAALRKLVDAEGSILSVEGFAAAATAGRRAFTAADHSGNATPAAPVRFVTGDVTKVVRREVANEETPNPDVVVLDPPRSGAGKDAIAAIAEAKPRTVVHFGCDPATFARDARYWADHGYAFKHLEVVDAFGLTHHFETIAVLEQL
ncbi:class I SAM-dependent RNA methyltransferase [Corynebacterium amycolatum]|uniref:Class I SAM-dependent RNA methyltransferase n=1 Tax=Corynebacterium amycolatum TaxID=43765 RepID=A0AB37G7D3_CORAY|nr:class I SAM-dependent RNA methyltransferase [Corynebacterium amycolatum]MCQ9124865.1 class I SAM-dependent RNA methyltransferase [Corynebacterium amycolatum]MCQ9128845.1 class I SAM-dependent RNA methyltransferase [Corynebacterium amycolatum]MCQ9142652.1 class I SAM-dependent RNA methyltransferase [Corynebacterium amycolatum]MCQ9169643.1 class I SAM-dependent RNA methyltransferase [Corynebacterium amycolatum]MCQ9175768.1 class I SAM-dependent RNA methyltransferase [Corynebacterium amycolatu